MRKQTVPFRGRGLLFCLILVFAFSFLSSRLSYGQTAGTILGTVRDDTGAVLPGVNVEVTNTETGRVQAGVSDDAGRYRVTGLPSGTYQVSGSLPGFKKVTRQGMQLSVAQELLIDLKLQVGEIVEEVEVLGEAPVVDTTVSSVSGMINTRQMTELPLNGRDFTQLSLLETGTINVRNAPQAINKGYGTRVAVAGSRPDQTSYLLDGTDINGFGNLQTPGSVAGVVLGVEAIREFRVQISNFSAEFGRSAGGVFNMVSKSGTNAFHGTAFEFHRNDNLDARNFFAIPDQAEFRRNQYGASLGGPIAKNRTFFFTNYEALKSAKGVAFVGFVPDENARRGFLPVAGGGLREVGVASKIRPIIQELYPAANGPNIGGGIATYFNSGNQVINEDYWMIRLDHEPWEQGSFFGRYNLDQGNLQDPDTLPNFMGVQRSRFQYLTLEQTQTFSASFLNVARFAFNRTTGFTDNEALHPISLTYRPGEPLSMQGLTVGGLSGTGGRDSDGAVQNVFQYTDNVYYTRGAHSFKFGGNLQRVQANFYDFGRLGGFNFPNLEAFLRGIPDLLSEAKLPGSDGVRGWRQWLPSLYLQDDWRVSPRFTLNVGLRWEPYTVPTEVNGKVSNLRDLLLDIEPTVGDPFWQNPSWKNFAPRLGLAWDPGGDGKTVVRAAYGIFYHLVVTPYYQGPGGRNAPFFFYMSVRNPSPDLFPDIVKIAEFETARGEVVGELKPIQFDPKSGYEQKFNLSVTRELFRDTALSLGYVGGRGINLLYLREANTAVSTLVDGRWVTPAGAGRRNPALGAMRQLRTGAQSFYNALQVRLDRRFSGGFQVRASYTFSRTIDDQTTPVGLSDFGEAGFPQNTDNDKADRSLSKIHNQNTLTVSWLYELPGGGLTGVGKALLANWKLNGIASLADGTPFTATLNFDNPAALGRFSRTLSRPDLAPGANNNPIRPGNPDQYFDPSVFIVPPPRTYGNLGRNTLIGPGYANLDLGITKDVPVAGISEDFTVQFRAEVFNLFNRAQFALPEVRTFSNRTTRLPTAGKITRTVGENRQIQLGLKLIW